MYNTCPDKKAYTARIEALKRQNWTELTQARNREGRRNILRLIRHGKFREAAGRCRRKLKDIAAAGPLRQAALSLTDLRSVLRPADRKKTAGSPDYFSDARIAVYTVILGGYDTVCEPRCAPDNCDFYLISDTAAPAEGSVWKQMELPEAVRERIRDLSPAAANRFLKMLPHLLFPGYAWSVYLDGNLQLVTDPTEFINRMNPQGAMFHKHVSRDCVYEEANAILVQKKAPEEAMAELTKFLRAEGMPEHYGLLECPVIVRRHHQPECLRLMEAWWEMFERFPYRDQMLLPYVLWKRGISTEELAGLGDNVRRCPSFHRYKHAWQEK